MIDPSVGSQPLATLTFIAAPAVLTNACALLALSTSNRFARTLDRTRAVARQLAAHHRPGATPHLTTDSEIVYAREDLIRQYLSLDRRTLLLLSALRSLYFALGALAAATMLSLALSAAPVLGQWGRGALVEGVYGVGILGVLGLIVACFRLTAETRAAVVCIREETRIVREKVARMAGLR